MRLRYGTGELYGLDFSALPPERIRELSLASHRDIECPFRTPEPGKPKPMCNKKGGVCSLRQFMQDDEGRVEARGEPVTTCPNRFLESNLAVRWVGESLLGTPDPAVISESPFLMGETEAGDDDQDAVGKIDKVLVNAEGGSLRWCALEIQAVYFSGKSMENDFKGHARVVGAWFALSASSTPARLPIIWTEAAHATASNQSSDYQPLGRESGGESALELRHSAE